MKKIIGLAITLALALVFMAASVSAESYEQKLGLLDALGISSPIAEKSDDDVVTRAEFAGIISGFTGTDKITFRQYYADVMKDTSNALEITAVSEAGFMVGDTEKYFHPEKEITGDEAVVVCMRVLGYEAISETFGGYFEGYKRAASAAGFSFVYGKGPLTKKQVVSMIRELLDTNVFEVVSYHTYPEYKMTGETLLEAMFNIYEDKGRITATPLTSLYSENGVSDGSVKIEDTVFDTSIDVADMIGRYVTFFYKDDENNMEAVYMYENGKDETATLTTADIESFSKYTYKEKKRRKEYRLSLDVSVIYNGCYVPYDSLTEDEMFPKDGVVELISTKANKLYDIVKIVSYEYYTVLNVSAGELQILDKYNKEKLDLDNEYGDKNISITAYGKKVEISYFKNGDVLEVLKSKNGKNIHVAMVLKKITGKAESIDPDEGTITIDGEVYSLYRGLEKAIVDDDGNVLRKEIELATDGDYYINDRGMVVCYVQKQDTSLQIGFIMRAKLAEDEVGTRIVFKILSEADPKLYFSTEKIYYTDVETLWKRKYSAIDLWDTLPKDTEGKFIRDMYMFRLDADGLVCELIPAVDKSKDPKYRGYSTDVFAKDWHRTDVRVFEQQIGTKYLPDGNTKVFKIPVDPDAPESLYFCSSMSAVFGSDDRNKTVTVYGSDENAVPKAVISWSEDIGLSRSSIDGVVRTSPLIVSSKKIAVLSNGEVGYVLQGYRNGSFVKLEVSDRVGYYSVTEWGYQNKKIEDIGVGDVIDFEVDSKGRIEYILPLLIAKERDRAKREAGAGGIIDYDALAILHTLNGKVIRGTDSTITVNSQPDLNPAYNRTYKTSTVAGTYLVENGKVEKISINDVVKGDEIFIRTYHHHLFDVVVYR